MLEYHKVVLPSEKGGLALIIFDGAEKVKRDDFFDVSRYGLGLQLTETDIDFNVLVGEGDDGYFGIGPSG